MLLFSSPQASVETTSTILDPLALTPEEEVVIEQIAKLVAEADHFEVSFAVVYR